MLRTLVDFTTKKLILKLCKTLERLKPWKKLLAYQFVAGLLPNIRAKIAGTEGTFEQLWVKARYEESKARDLEPKSTMGYSTNRRPPVVKEDGWMQPQNQPNQNAATRKCWLC